MTEVATNGNTPSDLEGKIIRQIEYYFGDHNLSRDKFLKEQITLDNGWIPLDVLIKFNRLKSLTTDFPEIIAALKKSTNELLEVDEAESKIRRSAGKPLPEINADYKKELAERTVYCKPFPEDSDIDDLLEYFKLHGKVENIFMKRDNKTFKGSIFVTFKTKDEANNFLVKEDVKYKDEALIRELRTDYNKRKAEQYAEAKKEKSEKKNVKNEEEAEPEEPKNIEETLTKDACIKISGMDETTSREDIKATFSECGVIAWVDSKIGDTEAVVRFKEEGDGKLALEKVKENGDGKINIKDKEVETYLLQGEEEIEYWRTVEKARAMMKNKHSGHKRGKGYKGSQGRGRGTRRGLRSGDRRAFNKNGEEPSAKKARVE